MKKITLTLFIAVFSIMAQAQSLVFHEIQGDETLWFLAQIYYGKGQNYPKIADANYLTAESHLEKGRRILIPEPLFTPSGEGFADRLQSLRKIRAQQLSSKINPSPKKFPAVVAEKIQNTLLPAAEGLKSPAKTAQDELSRQ